MGLLAGGDDFEDPNELKAQMALLKAKLEALGIDEEPNTNMTVIVAESIKRKFQKIASDEGTNMTALSRRIITEFVQNWKPSKKGGNPPQRDGN